MWIVLKIEIKNYYDGKIEYIQDDILGVTDSNINLLGQVEDKELVEAMNLNFDKKQNVKKPMNFADVLDIFMPRGSRNNTSVYQAAEERVNNLDSSENQEQ